MEFIKNDEQLRPYLPNAFATVKGESTWFLKLKQYLEDAEEWLYNEILGDAYRSVDFNAPERQSAYDIICRIVVAHALASGVPSLDLVMTPNGFGIVSTTNVAPASKDRIERLISSLIRGRDQRVSDLQHILEDDAQYKGGADGKFFSTLFRHVTDVCAFGQLDNLLASYFLKLPKIREIEDYIAENWVSPPLMERLRSVRKSEMTVHDKRLRSRLKNLVIRMAADEYLPSQAFADITQYLRENASEIPEWATSETAARFDNPIVYKNEKTDKGYWF